MSGIARKALRHPITWLLAAATVCAAAPGVVFAGASAAAVAADSTPPVITYSFGGTSGNDGWFRSDVTVRWYVSDPESIYSAGLECLNPAPMVATGDTRSCSATSAGGTSSITTPSIRIDKVPPTLMKAEVEKGDRFVTLSWAASGGVAAVTVTRSDVAAAAGGADVCGHRDELDGSLGEERRPVQLCAAGGGCCRERGGEDGGRDAAAGVVSAGEGRRGCGAARRRRLRGRRCRRRPITTSSCTGVSVAAG